MSKSGSNNRHVTRHPEGWAVVAPGASRASAVTRTQEQAAARAADIVAGRGGGEVVIHGRDGRIRDSDTIAPGPDPFPPRDKK